MSADATAGSRIHTREQLAARGVELARWYVASSLDAAIGALEALGGRGVLKPVRRGPESAGARRIRHPADLLGAWMTPGERRFVVEEALDVAAELSVTLLRAPGGARVALPPVETYRVKVGNVPRRAWCTAPAPLPPDVGERVVAAATAAGDVLAAVAEPVTVELLLLSDGRVVVNDVASGAHATDVALTHACGAPLSDLAARAARGSTTLPRAGATPAASMWVTGEPWCTDVPTLRSLRDALARWAPTVTLRAGALDTDLALASGAGTPRADATLTCCATSVDAALTQLRRARAWCGLWHGRLSAPPARGRRRVHALTTA